MDDPENPLNDYDEFIEKLDLPEATCDQVHPIVEAFMEDIDPADPDWPGDLSDWMEQANTCLTTEIMDNLGNPPEDPDEAEDYVWSVIRLSWLFYRKFHDGKPFDS